MAQTRTAGCPLCGAKMTAEQLWSEIDELIHEALGVHSARCPYCQGYLEVQKQGDELRIGYLNGHGENARFDTVLVLRFRDACL